jgi:hypothetical protein
MIDVKKDTISSVLIWVWLSVSCSTMNELVDKFNTAYDKQNRRAGRSTFI